MEKIKEWREGNDEFHIVKNSLGDIFWYKNGKYFRTNGPAVIIKDLKMLWCCNGFLHRINGPAVELSNGANRWYFYEKLCENQLHLILIYLKYRNEH